MSGNAPARTGAGDPLSYLVTHSLHREYLNEIKYSRVGGQTADFIADHARQMVFAQLCASSHLEQRNQ